MLGAARALRPGLLDHTGNMTPVGPSRNAGDRLGGFYLLEEARLVRRALVVAGPEEDGTAEQIVLGPGGRSAMGPGPT
jgi:hypothetical protein